MIAQTHSTVQKGSLDLYSIADRFVGSSRQIAIYSLFSVSFFDTVGVILEFATRRAMITRDLIIVVIQMLVPFTKIYDIGTKSLYEPQFDHNSTQKTPFSMKNTDGISSTRSLF